LIINAFWKIGEDRSPAALVSEASQPAVESWLFLAVELRAAGCLAVTRSVRARCPFAAPLCDTEPMRAAARRRRLASTLRIWATLRSSADRSVLFEAALLLPLVFVGLRTVGWLRMHRFLDRPSAPVRRSIEEARHLAGLVEAVARRGPVRYTCLQRSTVLWRVLRRRGLEAELLFGVRNEGPGDHRFHAWVEHAGHVLNDTPDVRERFARFGTAPDEREGS
jgi:transglutaminase superfamily protein